MPTLLPLDLILCVRHCAHHEITISVASVVAKDCWCVWRVYHKIGLHESEGILDIRGDYIEIHREKAKQILY